MFVLNTVIDGEVTVKILDSPDEIIDFEQNNCDNLDHTPFRIDSELLILVITTLKDNRKLDLTEKSSNLSQFEIEFIEKLIGAMQNYCYLIEYYDVCGKSNMRIAGFWLKNTENNWIALESLSDTQLIMGYVKPIEIMQYLKRVQLCKY